MMMIMMMTNHYHRHHHHHYDCHTFGKSFLASNPRKVMVNTVVIPDNSNHLKCGKNYEKCWDQTERNPI